MASDNGDKGPQVLAVNLFLLILTVLVVSLRIASRKVSSAGLGIDDLFIGIAEVALIAYCSTSIFLYTQGLGKHIDTVSGNLVIFLKAIYAIQFAYDIGRSAYKLSIAFLYLRLFGFKQIRVVIHIVIAQTCAFAICSLFEDALECIPITATWRLDRGPTDRCISLSKLLLSLAIPNVVLDWVLLLVPVPIVWKLQMSTIQKVEILAIMALGAAACVISLVRLILALRLSNTDITWASGILNILCTAEMGVGIICPCLITLRPLLRRILGQTATSSDSGQPPRSAGTGHTNILTQKPSGNFERIKISHDTDRADSTELTYHAVIAREAGLLESDVSPLAGIRVAENVDIESRAGYF